MDAFWYSCLMVLLVVSQIGLMGWVAHIKYRQGINAGKIEATQEAEAMFESYRDTRNLTARQTSMELTQLKIRLAEVERENGELKLLLSSRSTDQ